MFNILARQFENPKGMLGKLAGKIMYSENRTINSWTVKKLDIKNKDRILEVGYGPGYCIKYIMNRCRCVYMDGADLSKDMAAAAEKRNKEWIDEGRVRLFTGDIHSIASNLDTYHKIISINNYPLWTKPRETLGMLYEKTEAGGEIAITVQPREKDADSLITKNLAKIIEADLASAGYEEIQSSFKDVQPVLAVCVTAKKGRQ